jgi:ribosome-binding factor A
MESRRQEKFAKLLQRDLGDIFLQKAASLFKGSFITISGVKVSPDLGYAKVYLSFFKAANNAELLDAIRLNTREIRHELAGKIKNQVRKVPELEFFLDESLDYVDRMEKVFKEINTDDHLNNTTTD